MTEWAGINIQTIYNRIKHLEESGYIKLEAVKKEGNMPERNVYRPLKKAYGYLHENIIEALRKKDETAVLISLGFMLPVLDRRIVFEIEDLYNHSREILEEKRKQKDAPEHKNIPPNWKILMESGIEFHDVFIKTIGKILKVINDGKLPVKED